MMLLSMTAAGCAVRPPEPESIERPGPYTRRPAPAGDFTVIAAESQGRIAFSNAYDLVKLCVESNKTDEDIRQCVRRSVNGHPFLGKPRAPVAALTGDPILYDVFRVNKHIDYDESDKRYSKRFNVPSSDYFFCGYNPSEESNITSAWSVQNISEHGADAFATVHAAGNFVDRRGGSLVLTVNGRYVSKLSAGVVDKELRCDEAPWRMQPSGNSRIPNRVDTNCIMGVLACTEYNSLNEVVNRWICGICPGFQFR